MINYLKHIVFLYRLRKDKHRIKMGKSHLMDGFRLSIYKPQSEKIYLNIGDDNLLECKVVFESGEGNLIIGNRNYIGNSTIICKSQIVFESNIFVAWGCVFYDHNSHSIDYRERQNDISQQIQDYRNGIFFIENKNWAVVDSKPIVIRSNAWIGMNCTILKGVTIGEGAIVAAGSVVVKDVPDWTIVGGNPATVIKELPKSLRKE